MVVTDQSRFLGSWLQCYLSNQLNSTVKNSSCSTRLAKITLALPTKAILHLKKPPDFAFRASSFWIWASISWLLTSSYLKIFLALQNRFGVHPPSQFHLQSPFPNPRPEPALRDHSCLHNHAHFSIKIVIEVFLKKSKTLSEVRQKASKNLSSKI